MELNSIWVLVHNTSKTTFENIHPSIRQGMPWTGFQSITWQIYRNKQPFTPREKMWVPHRKARPGTFLLWDVSPNHCTTMPFENRNWLSWYYPQTSLWKVFIQDNFLPNYKDLLSIFERKTQPPNEFSSALSGTNQMIFCLIVYHINYLCGYHIPPGVKGKISRTDLSPSLRF